MKRQFRNLVKRTGTIALTCAMILTSFPGTYSTVYADTPIDSEGNTTSVSAGISVYPEIPNNTYIAWSEPLSAYRPDEQSLSVCITLAVDTIGPTPKQSLQIGLL